MKYAIRALLRDKSFLVIAVLTLAFGIGANTAIFSVVNGVLLKPLSYHDPDRLYLARTIARELAFIAPDLPVNARHFHEWRTRCQSCEGVALVGGTGLTLTGQGDPERLPGLMVSANFFRTLGVHPILGRDFDRTDEGPGRARVVILSDSFWRRRFNADPSAAGRTIVLDGEPHQIVGVMPPTLHLPKGEQ